MRAINYGLMGTVFFAKSEHVGKNQDAGLTFKYTYRLEMAIDLVVWIWKLICFDLSLVYCFSYKTADENQL